MLSVGARGYADQYSAPAPAILVAVNDRGCGILHEALAIDRNEQGAEKRPLSYGRKRPGPHFVPAQQRIPDLNWCPQSLLCHHGALRSAMAGI